MPPTTDATAPLLTQAQQALAEAQTQERRLRRDVALPGAGVAWDQVNAAAHDTRVAQGWLDQVERSCAALPAALADARRTLYQAESACTQVEAQARQTIARARRQVEQAREEVARLEADWRTLAGSEAVPA